MPAPMLKSTDSADAPVNGGNELMSPALAQVREADGDDEKGLEPFPEGDDERLQHDGDLEIETESQSYHQIRGLRA